MDDPKTSKPVDIGWRWCKDELPEKERVYLVLHETGMDIALYAKDGSWYIKPTGDYRPAPCFSIVQWCRLPEPLPSEGENPPSYNEDWWASEDQADARRQMSWVTKEELYQKFKERLKAEGGV